MRRHNVLYNSKIVLDILSFFKQNMDWWDQKNEKKGCTQYASFTLHNGFINLMCIFIKRG